MRLLRDQSNYRVDVVLPKLEEYSVSFVNWYVRSANHIHFHLISELHYECCEVYGQVGLHDKALHVLIHILSDHSAAQHYCIQHTKGKVPAYRIATALP